MNFIGLSLLIFFGQIVSESRAALSSFPEGANPRPQYVVPVVASNGRLEWLWLFKLDRFQGYLLATGNPFNGFHFLPSDWGVPVYDILNTVIRHPQIKVVTKGTLLDKEFDRTPDISKHQFEIDYMVTGEIKPGAQITQYRIKTPHVVEFNRKLKWLEYLELISSDQRTRELISSQSPGWQMLVPRDWASLFKPLPGDRNLVAVFKNPRAPHLRIAITTPSVAYDIQWNRGGLPGEVDFANAYEETAPDRWQPIRIKERKMSNEGSLVEYWLDLGDEPIHVMDYFQRNRRAPRVGWYFEDRAKRQVELDQNVAYLEGNSLATFNAQIKFTHKPSTEANTEIESHFRDFFMKFPVVIDSICNVDAT